MQKVDINGNTIDSKYDCFAYRNYIRNVLLTEDGKVFLVADSPEEADSLVKQLEFSALKGEALAQYCYGYVMSLSRYGQYEKAFDMLMKSYANGCIHGAFRAGTLIEIGAYGQISDPAFLEQRFNLIYHTAMDGHPSACMRMVEMLEDEPDTLKYRISYLVAAARGNHPIAQVSLAKMYLEGNEYIDEDWITAREWFRRAAQNGNIEAVSWCSDNDVYVGFKENGIVRMLKQIYNHR